jgi:nucleoside-diphosphate-sugar epimerase
MLNHPAFANDSITLVDTGVVPNRADSRVVIRKGDLRDPTVRADLIEANPTIVFHLAGILGGTAEVHYELARQVNVDATLSLFGELRDRRAPPKVIFASSIAVFGPMTHVSVTDETPPAPLMLYGAQKYMMEVALANFSVRGELDGMALRLPGIIARADADERMKSSFLHRLFAAYQAGQSYTLPVSPDGTSWLLSVQACIDALIHAALLPANVCQGRRAITLPAQRVSMRALLGALSTVCPRSDSKIDFAPEPDLEAQFACQPPLSTAAGDALGFRHDGSVDTLVRRACASARPRETMM